MYCVVVVVVVCLYKHFYFYYKERKELSSILPPILTHCGTVYCGTVALANPDVHSGPSDSLVLYLDRTWFS